MNLPDLRKLPATAKAQFWGLALSFALGLHFTNQAGYSIGAFVLGFLLAWAAWEMSFGLKLAAKLGSDMRSVAIALAIGLVLPWFGFALAYALYALRP